MLENARVASWPIFIHKRLLMWVRIGRLPLIKAERVGVHWFCTLKFVNRTPWLAKLSMLGI